MRKHGEEFVRALTSLTENLLFQMDNLLTVDEVQVGRKSPSILASLVDLKVKITAFLFDLIWNCRS